MSMTSEQLHYGIDISRTIDDGALFVDIPEVIHERAMRYPTRQDGPKIPTIFHNLEHTRVLETVTSTEPGAPGSHHRVHLHAGRIGTRPNLNASNLNAEAVVQYLEAVNFSLISHHEADPRLNLSIAARRLPDGERLGMSAMVRRPDTDDNTTATCVLAAMQSMAHAVYNPAGRYRQRINDSIGAFISRQYGVRLEADNQLGAAGLYTEGNDYANTRRVIELNGHNLHNHKQQLICLAGVVALAHTDDFIGADLSHI